MNAITTQTVQAPEEVQADIEKLKAEQQSISDQIFALEQTSMDYRSVLSHPEAGVNRLAELALLRERLRSIEIALIGAHEALGDAELQVKRERLFEIRATLKGHLSERNAAGEAVAAALDLLAEGLIKIWATSQDAKRLMNFNVDKGVLTEKGWIVIGGARTLGQIDLMQNWVNSAIQRRLGSMWPYDKGSPFGMAHDLPAIVEETGQNVLREWDAANRSQQFKIIDHDPVEVGELIPAHDQDAVTVLMYDEDPTEEDLSAIALMEPKEAVKALAAFSNSKWARANGMTFPAA